MYNNNHVKSESLLNFFILSAEIRMMHESGLICNVLWHKYILACIRSCEKLIVRKAKMNQATMNAVNTSLEQIIHDNSYIKAQAI